jgi:hypothetical protein
MALLPDSVTSDSSKLAKVGTVERIARAAMAERRVWAFIVIQYREFFLFWGEFQVI